MSEQVKIFLENLDSNGKLIAKGINEQISEIPNLDKDFHLIFQTVSPLDFNTFLTENKIMFSLKKFSMSKDGRQFNSQVCKDEFHHKLSKNFIVSYLDKVYLSAVKDKCLDIETFIYDHFSKSQVNESNHQILPNGMHSTSLLSNNNYYYTFDNNKKIIDKVLIAQNLHSILDESFNINQSIIKEIEGNQKQEENTNADSNNIFNDINKTLDNLKSNRHEFEQDIDIMSNKHTIKHQIIIKFKDSFDGKAIVNKIEQLDKQLDKNKKIVDLDTFLFNQEEMDALNATVKKEDRQMKD